MRKKALLLLFLSGILFPSFSFSQKKKLDSLLKRVEIKQADTSLVDLYVNISREYVYSDQKKAIEFAEKAEVLAKKIAYIKGQGQAKRNFGIIEFYKGNFKGSITIYEEALKLAEAAKDSSVVAQLERAIGISYDRLGDMSKAKDHYSNAIEKFTALGDSGGIAACYNSIAVVYVHYGSLQKALEYSFKSLKLREGKKNEERNTADMYNNIGGIYLKMHDGKSALQYYYKAVPIREKMNDVRGLAISYNSLANIFLEQSQFDSVEYYSVKALTYADKIKFAEVIASSNSFLGQVYAHQKNYPKAYSFYMQSLNSDAQSGDIEGYLTELINLSDLSIITGDYPDAIKKYKTACDSALKYDFSRILEKCYSGLASAYSKQGNGSEAYVYLLKAYGLKDTLAARSNSKSMAEMQALYETEKSEKEIELQNEKLKVQDIAIAQQEKVQYFYLAGIFLFAILAFFIYRNFRQKQKSERLLEQKNRVIEEKGRDLEERNKDVTDSINYAKRIQEAILPSEENTRAIFPDSFVLFRPRDIVSGDFFWHTEKNGKKIIAAADCTGHGVPGAFMSMLGNAFLNEVVKQRGITNAGAILGELRHLVISTLRQTAAEGENKDGMDMALLVFDTNDNSVEFAGANNPFLLVRNEGGENKLYEHLPDKRPIGFFKGKGLPFTTVPVKIEKGDALYIFTDGFADQFGGEKQKKFKYKQLKEKLIALHSKTMDEQKQELEKIFVEWQGPLEQVDDVLVIGVRV